MRWEEGKKWQSRLEGTKSKLKEKEKAVEVLTKQVTTLKELYAKVDQEKLYLQRKLKARGITADQVIGVRTMDCDREIEDLRRKNMELQDQMATMRQQQALPRDSVVEDLTLKNRYLHEKIQTLERQLSASTLSRPSTSGIGSDASSQKEQQLQKENLGLSADNVELRFQLEQANKDLPRLRDQIVNLQEMYQLLKKEKADMERKLGSIRGQSGRSGKTVPELEKTIGLMKKVVERVQRENEELKKAPGVVSCERRTCLEMENEKLKAELEKLKLQIGGQLSSRYETKTKGMEKILAENERLRKEIKREGDNSEKLRIAKSHLEILNEKLSTQLEETTKQLSFAESRGPQLEGADGKSWKSVVVTRMYESKIKEMENDLVKKNQSLTDLRQQMKESTDNEQRLAKQIGDMEEQIEVLKHFPDEAKTEPGLTRQLQLLRLTNDRLEKEKAELHHHLEMYKHTRAEAGTSSRSVCDAALDSGLKDDKLVGEQTQHDLEKQQLQEEIKRLKKELENFDPCFFEELEDLKFNYNQEVKRNILLEEQLKKLSEQFGMEMPGNVSID